MRHRSDIGLADVLTSGAAAVGAPGFVDSLGIGECPLVVVCLVDGLGAEMIEQNSDIFDSLDGALGGSIEAAFPTTTSTGLATLGTGISPGRHGLVGASFCLPDVDAVLSPLHWGRDPLPQSVQPEPTVFERTAAAGVRSVTIAPAAYANSGLTSAAMRGSQYLAAETAQARVDRLRDVSADGRPCLAYVYWAALDRAAHEFGLHSDSWRRAAIDVDGLIGMLRASLPASSALVVTADHGMVDCGERLWIEDFPELLAGVRLIAGEPRMRHVYVEDEPEVVAHRWRAVLGDRARVLPKSEAIVEGLFGEVDEHLIARIGDVLAIAQGTCVLASRSFDERVSLLRGHHGALSDAERRVPGLIVRT